jgi:hypothetical protein
VAIKVLDSYALITFFEDEPGAEIVEALILKAEEGNVELAISVVNLGEVWYSIARKHPHLLQMSIFLKLQGWRLKSWM